MSKGTVNKVIILGRLGEDPEIRYSATGDPMVRMNIATNEGYKDSNGQYINSTEWHRVVSFKKNVDWIEQYLKKGSLVYIEGKIKTKEYTDKEGKKKQSSSIIATEIQMVGGKNGTEEECAEEVLVDKRPKKPLAFDNKFEDDSLTF